MAGKIKEPIYQLKITLRGAKPPIWRRVQTPGHITLARLHVIIQESMGWYDAHLHQFTIGGMEYGVPDPEWTAMGMELLDESKVYLDQIVTGEGDKFVYEYDFGDSWEHIVLVEKIFDPDPEVAYPVCITGRRACPPEDVGGVWGYAEFLEIIKDPEHESHEMYVDWLGDDFDPAYFDLDEVNELLAELR